MLHLDARAHLKKDEKKSKKVKHRSKVPEMRFDAYESFRAVQIGSSSLLASGGQEPF